MSHQNDSNPPINITTNRRFILTFGTATSLVLAVYLVSANYFEMRADDRSLKEVTIQLSQRVSLLESTQSILLDKISRIEGDVRWLRELREQEIRRKQAITP